MVVRVLLPAKGVWVRHTSNICVSYRKGEDCWICLGALPLFLSVSLTQILNVVVIVGRSTIIVLFRLYILNSPHPSVFQDMIRSSPAVRKAVPYMLPFIHTPDAVAAGMKLFNFKGLRSLYPPTVPTSLMDSLVDAWSQRNSVNTMVYWYPANFDTANILSWTGFNATFPYPLRIKVPTIVGWGMQDNIFQAEYNLPYVSSYVPQLKISQYPLGSHFPETDVPSAIAADIRALALGTAFPLV